jgi:hypothetical protein
MTQFAKDPSTPDISTMAPFTDAINITITPADVAAAILATKNTASGPDGLETIFLLRASDVLPDLLAPAFTRALSDFLAGMRQAETLLIAKEPGKPSCDPLKYRPVTLLPVLVRLYHRLLSCHIAARTSRPRFFIPSPR